MSLEMLLYRLPDPAGRKKENADSMDAKLRSGGAMLLQTRRSCPMMQRLKHSTTFFIPRWIQKGTEGL